MPCGECGIVVFRRDTDTRALCRTCQEWVDADNAATLTNKEGKRRCETGHAARTIEPLRGSLARSLSRIRSGRRNKSDRRGLRFNYAPDGVLATPSDARNEIE